MTVEQRLPIPEPPRRDPVPGGTPPAGPSPAGLQARDHLARIDAAIARVERQREQQLSSESVLKALRQTGGQ